MLAGVWPLAGNHCFDYMFLMCYDHVNMPLVNDNSLSVGTDLIFTDGGVQFMGFARRGGVQNGQLLHEFVDDGREPGALHIWHRS